MNRIYFLAVAAVLFAACADKDGIDDGQLGTQNGTVAGDGSIGFDAHMLRATSRAGVAGNATTALLKDNTSDLGKAGFGVFAYYTDNFDYTPLYQPNFMYNEQVKWDAGRARFDYALTKYWPNEHGSAAVSSDMDRVSFFAYLPYVQTDPATGMLVDDGGDILAVDDPAMQYGITGMKRNTLQGDPVIQYVTCFDQAKSVDLCWGVVGTGQQWSTNSEAAKTLTAGMPWLNVRKPDGVSDDASRVRFTFRHALAKLAVNVQTDFTAGWTETPQEQTKVWVRSIRFTGLAQKAALNLNNPKPDKARWIDYYGTNEMEMGEWVTVYDGRKDGCEGIEGAEAINEAILGLNPALVQVAGQIEDLQWKPTGAGIQPGVTTTPVNLFCNGTAAATGGLCVIPTGEKVNVEIVYDIETIDKKLPTMLSDGATPGSSVENRIMKTAVFDKLESGKSYTLNLKLGLKDVQFTAEVTDAWTDTDPADVHLPDNMPTYAAGTSPTMAVPYNLTSIDHINISGLTAGTVYTPEVTSPVTTATGGTADSNGKLVVSGITLTANASVNKQTGTVKVGSDTEEETTVSITQAAKPFVLKDIAINTGTTSFAIEAGDGSGTVTGENWTAVVTSLSGDSPALKIELVTRYGGTEVIHPLVLTTNFTAGSDKINITSIAWPETLQVGDVIRITITVGDAPQVVKEFTVTAAPDPEPEP